MSDLISREALLQSIATSIEQTVTKPLSENWLVPSDGLLLTASLVGNAPSAEAVEVKNGKWLHIAKQYDQEHGLGYLMQETICSVCKTSPTKSIDGQLRSAFEPPYCPNCGATMDADKLGELSKCPFSREPMFADDNHGERSCNKNCSIKMQNTQHTGTSCHAMNSKECETFKAHRLNIEKARAHDVK